MISWEQYAREFTKHYDELKVELLEPESIECNGGPVVKATDRKHPRSAPFRVEWGVIFKEGKYFRVYECYERMGSPNSGLGNRNHFSFHYGVASTEIDFDGFPEIRKPETPVADLRIDIDRHNKPHIHLNSVDHIPQSQIGGYSIRDADMIQFLQAVISHRKTKAPLHELLGIKVLM
jgi:hypothetical protein